MALSLFLTIAPVGAQDPPGQGYTLDDLVTMIGAFEVETILARVSRDCLAFRMDTEAEERLRAAGAQDQLITALQDACYRGEEIEAEVPAPLETDTPGAPATTVLYDPGSAGLRSLAIPGLGQFYTGRRFKGAIFLAGWAGAIAYGAMSERETVVCLERGVDPCPPGQVQDRIVERPKLLMGIAGAAVLAVVSALDARSGATRENTRLTAQPGQATTSGLLLKVLPPRNPGGTGDLVVLQVRF
jgi:hypothetical protein